MSPMWAIESNWRMRGGVCEVRWDLRFGQRSGFGVGT